MLGSCLVLALAAGGLAPAAPAGVSHANIAEACQWPTVVSMRAGEDKCTGTLVHPRVVVTAAHCLDEVPAGAIRLGEQFQPAALKVDTERCGLHPDWARTGAPADDLGWCVLAEPVEGIPPTPPLTGCETGVVREGEPAVIAGFGVSDQDDLFGTKRYAFTVLHSDLHDDGTVWVGDAEVNGCMGDSGGPAFVQAPGGTWHALGVLSFGPACGQGPVLYRTLHDRLAWLEAETGFDLAPCHDTDGGWDPGPACGSIAADPLAEGGEWSERCEGERLPAPACSTWPDPAPADPDAATTAATATATTDPPPGASTGDDPAATIGAEAPADDAAGCGCRASAPPPGGMLLPGGVLLLLLAGLRPLSRRRQTRPRCCPLG